MNCPTIVSLTGLALAGVLLTSGCRTTGAGKSTSQASQDERTALVERHSAADRVRSGIALGGLGTGSVELRKDGQFYNWTIFNNQPLGTGPAFAFATYPNNAALESMQFFVVRYQEQGGEIKLKLLQHNDSVNEGGLTGVDYYYPWMKAVSTIEHTARFPFVKLKFTDPEMPFEIHLEAFSPFIPHDVKNSALPAAYFNFKVVATGSKPVNVMLIATQRNAVGYDTQKKHFISNVVHGDGYTFIGQTAGMNDKAHTYGQMGLFSIAADTTYHAGWEQRHPYYEQLLVENRLRNLNVTEERNKVHPITGEKFASMGSGNKDQRAFTSLAVTRDLKPGQSFEHGFGMAWYFPNSYGSHNEEEKELPKGHERLRTFEGPYSYMQKITKDQGHLYQKHFANAAEVANYVVKRKQELTTRTRGFFKDFYTSDAPTFVLDQINSHLNTFVTSSTLTAGGKFAIREGLSPDQSWGPNATMDVSLYGSSAVISLFPELQKSSMRAHRALQAKEGEVNHGLGYDLDFTQNGTWGVTDRIDLPGGYIQMVLRDYFHTNDRAYLEEMWPSLKMAVNYVLTKRDVDKDMMPDTTGIMTSYDNFPMYGLSSYVQSQWVAAMRSMMEAAKVMQDQAGLVLYQKIYEAGSRIMDEHLWNGQYYILSRDYTGLTKDMKGTIPRDDAALTDQIVGQWIAHQSGLGYLFKEDHVKQALRKIMEMSFRPGFGLRNASWPQHPAFYPMHETELWVDQANTPWTGVELAFASFLLYEGFYNESLAVIKEVDKRYRRAGLYWDHQEFGGHYYRPMSSWQIVNALLGLSINRGRYSFAPKLPAKTFKLFFAFNAGTAHYEQRADSVAVHVRSGAFKPEVLELAANAVATASPRVFVGERAISVQVERAGDRLRIILPPGFQAESGQSILVR